MPAKDVVIDRIPEWKLQAAIAARLERRVVEGERFAYAAALEGVIGHLNPHQTQKAAATGMKAGEPDLRLYFSTGLVLVELKGDKGSLTQSQKDRIPLLRSLGFTVHIVFAATEAEAVEAVNRIVDMELAGADSSALPSASWFPKARCK